jgi:predicted transcriptional regulator
MAKRNKLEIIRDILKIVQNSHKIKVTPLLRKSNISSSRFKKYYSDLIEKGFIKEIPGKDRHVVLMEKGARFIERYLTIVSFIDEFEL